MKQEGRRTKFAAIGLIALLLMALGAIAVFAQDDATPEAPELPILPNDKDNFSNGFHGRVPRDGFHGDFHGDFHHGRPGFDGARGASDEALAEALGISVEELQAAREKVAAERIAQAVEDGILTRDQANTMLAMQALKGYLDRDTLLAEALGVSVEDLQAARAEGTLSELMGDTTTAELRENMQAAVEKVVQQAVSDNAITQEQADLVLDSLQNGLGMHGAFGPQRGFGGRGNFHGFRSVPQNGDSTDGDAFAPFHNFSNMTTSGA